MTDVITSLPLQHISLIGGNILPPPEDPLSLQTNTVAFGAGLPPVPSKLVARIEAGEFRDMVELLPDHVCISRPNDTGKASTKHCTLSGILEWRISNLLAYVSLIIEAQIEYSGDAWLGYDIRF